MLYNNGKKLIKKTKIADNLFLRFKGLMFEDKKNFDYALIFKFPKASKIGTSLHMLFVFFPIDVLFLNAEKKVVDKTTMNPWQLNYTPKKEAKYVIEIPKGKGKEVKISDLIEWK